MIQLLHSFKITVWHHPSGWISPSVYTQSQLNMSSSCDFDTNNLFVTPIKKQKYNPDVSPPIIRRQKAFIKYCVNENQSLQFSNTEIFKQWQDKSTN